MTAQRLAAFDLEGRVAIVTGAARGIGVGIAELLAEAGATVIVADILAERAEAQAAALTQAGHRAAAVQLDVTDEACIVRVCAQIVAEHGAPWILVNNAGNQDRQMLLDGTAEQWDRLNKINGRGPFLMTREVARAMIVAGAGGRIINIASTSLTGQVVQGLACYAASKGAVLALSRISAYELAEHAITVNTVLPGGVGTEGAINAKGPPSEGPGRRIPPLGHCEPRDIGAGVLFFATPMARYVTNQVLTVDAGFSIT